jgi:hypothetical protein
MAHCLGNCTYIGRVCRGQRRSLEWPDHGPFDPILYLQMGNRCVSYRAFLDIGAYIIILTPS